MTAHLHLVCGSFQHHNGRVVAAETVWPAKPEIFTPWTFTEKRKFLTPSLEEAKWKEIHGVSGKEIQHALPLRVKSTHSW